MCPAISTNKSRVFNMISNMNGNLYLAIAKVTEWNDIDNIPTPSPTNTQLDGLIYIKKIQIKHPVIVNDPYSSIVPDCTVNNILYNYVDDKDIVYDSEILRLYMSVEITFSDIAPTNISFRQIGILLDPKDSNGNILTNEQYLAEDVFDHGQLIYLNNIAAISKDPSQTERFDIIRLF